MNKTKSLLLPVLIVGATLSGCQTTLNASSNQSAGSDNQHAINQAEWERIGASFKAPDLSQLSQQQSHLVFYRPVHPSNDEGAGVLKADVDSHQYDKANQGSPNQDNPSQGSPSQDSIVIGINDTFHTSLQAGNYSEVVSCSGKQTLSTEFSDNNNNFLDMNSLTANLLPQQAYYFRVDVDEQNNMINLNQVDSTTALASLQGMTEQKHQINRVTATNCADKSQPENIIELTPSVDAPVSKPEVADELVVRDQTIRLSILFDNDSAQIKSDYMPMLDKVAAFMRTNPDITAIVEGHTDSNGAASYNQALSLERANKVKSLLVNKYDVASDRISTKGYGESMPIDTNATDQGRHNNRRVVAIIIQ